jgi:hypothetical protein
MALCAILKENLLKNKSITWFRLLLIKVFFKGYISIGNPNRNFPQSRWILQNEPLLDAIDSFNERKKL